MTTATLCENAFPSHSFQSISNGCINVERNVLHDVSLIFFFIIVDAGGCIGYYFAIYLFVQEFGELMVVPND